MRIKNLSTRLSLFSTCTTTAFPKRKPLSNNPHGSSPTFLAKTFLIHHVSPIFKNTTTSTTTSTSTSTSTSTTSTSTRNKLRILSFDKLDYSVDISITCRARTTLHISNLIKGKTIAARYHAILTIILTFNNCASRYSKQFYLLF